MSAEAIPGKLLKVTVHGATIASLLYSLTAGGAPCDGILFGDTVTTTSQQLRDDDDPATVTETHAELLSVLCCASCCSFYDGAGEISDACLGELVRQQAAPMLGWVSYRPAAAAAGGGGMLRPSAREMAVTEALLRRQLASTAAGGAGSRSSGGGSLGSGYVHHPGATLLLLVTSSVEHSGATLTWQYRCFQARLAPPSGRLLLEPLELHTLNLGGHTGAPAYQLLTDTSSTASTVTATTTTSNISAQAHPSTHVWAGGSSSPPTSRAATPPLPTSSAASVTGGTVPSQVGAFDAAAWGALVVGARAQAAAVQQACEGMLGSIQELGGRAAPGEAVVAALRRRRDELLSALGRLG